MIFLKKILFLSISILIGILVHNKTDEIIIPSDAIRFRIIANSNDIKDLYEKKKLKSEIEDDIYKLVENTSSSLEAKESIKNNLDEIEKMVSSRTSDYKINYGMNYFPKKTYKGVIYPSGNYESLVITLGKGLGDNFWCVLYPPLCLINENDVTSDVEYRSFIYDLINKYPQ